jgi:hypothetical protein
MVREALYSSALKNMRQTVHVLAAQVPQPVKVPYKTSFLFRYEEKTPQQAIVQKLARVVTTLTATHIVMEHGFVQEQGALQRMLHEMHEDVIFLSYAVIYDDLTPLHQRYLDAFYEEEFDAETAVASTQRRAMPRRAKIQAYIANCEGSGLDPSTHINSLHTLTKAYSGYVHAASPQIMDLYGGRPPHFNVEGMRDTSRQTQHRLDLWNYYYRSILAFGVAAKAFGDTALFNEIQKFVVKFERTAHKTYTPPSPK